MKEKIYSIIGVVLILFIILFRSYYYNKIYAIMKDRDYNTKINIENILYDGLNEQLYFEKIQGQNIYNSKLEKAIINGNKEEVIDTLLEAKKDKKDIDSITLNLENGQTFSTSSTSYTKINNDYNVEEWYLKTSQKNDICLIGHKNNDGTYSCYISYPIVIENQFYGVYNISLKKTVFEEMINNMLSKEKQVIIKDEDGNIIYEHVPKFNAKSSTEKNIHVKEKFDENYSFDFIVEVYYEPIDRNFMVIVIQSIFSLIFLTTLVMGIRDVYISKNKTFLTRMSLECLIVLLVEWGIILSYMVSKYDKFVNSHLVAISELKTVVSNDMESYCDIVANHLKESGLIEFFASNDYKISNDTYVPTDLKNEFINNKIQCKYIISSFFIGADGRYRVYPNSTSTNIRDINYKYYRKIVNSNRVETAYSFEEEKSDDENDEYSSSNVIYTKYYKIKNDNGNTLGILGINMSCSKLIDRVNDLINNGDSYTKFKILKNGNVYSYGTKTLYEYIENKKYKNEFKFKFTEEKKTLMLNSKISWLKEDNVLNAIRYVHFYDFTNEDIYMMQLNIEKEEITNGMTAMSLIIIFTAVIAISIAMYLVDRKDDKYINAENEIKKSITKKYSQNLITNEKFDDEFLNRTQIFDKEIMVNGKTHLFVNLKNDKKK